MNPLLDNWNTDHGLPPFHLVKAEHFAPAFAVALQAHRVELDAIAANPAPPTFANTLAAFDRAGRQFARVAALFENLTASETSPALQAVEREMAAPLAAHTNAIYMHQGLFARIDKLAETRALLGLSAEEGQLLARVHLDFVRAGAKLSQPAQARYGAIMERLAELTTQFTQNVLADEASYQLVLRTEADLAGLPRFVRTAAREAASARGLDDAWLITLSRSLVVPFLTFSARRDLREAAYTAWTSRGENAGSTDNRPIIREIMALRLEQANIHGYASYADYALADTMAGTQDAVTTLIKEVWSRAVPKAALECEALRAMALSHGDRAEIAPWDWRYLAEKVRSARYDLDEASVKPYFSLDRMVEAAFDCAHQLFGISFHHRADLVAYHPDVKTYEVRDQNRVIGVFLHDNFARATKRGGAWMNAYRMQSRIDGEVIPIIVNNNNFAKGAAGEPTLLSFDDARTLFHEFGHGLHGLLSNVHYERLSGTNVLRDFVELPSQLFEHWLGARAVLKKHARHVETGAPIPDSLIAKIEAARTFNKGFDTVEYCSSALVDMALHAKTDMTGLDISAFENAELAKIGMPTEIKMRHRLPHFQHLFSSSSYAAAYYVYLWAEVLDADAFGAFDEAGDPFHPDTAARLRRFIYGSGSTLPPMEAYAAFRGRAPTVTPMLKKKGLVEA